MPNSEDDIKYVSKILDYSPVIKNTWDSRNEVGNSDRTISNSTTEDAIIDVTDGTPSLTPTEDPFTTEKAMYTSIMNNSTSEATLDILNATIYSLGGLQDKFSSSAIDYTNTLYMIDHSISFWTSMTRLLDHFSLTEESIKAYNDLCTDKNEMYEYLGVLESNMSTAGEGVVDKEALLSMSLDYTEKQAIADQVDIQVDSARTQCFMSSDINRAIIASANECQYICTGIYAAPENETNALDVAAADTFAGLSKDSVTSIGDIMSDEINSDLTSLRRVADSGTDTNTIESHISSMINLGTYKSDVMPNMKYIMRNNQTDCDFTNMVINDMLSKSLSVDDKYKTSLVNTIQYMSAENSILLKTFSSEAKLNRFKMAVNYIKD